MLALLDRLASAYGDDWWFGGMHAFAQVETGDLVRGLATIERSLERNPRNAHGAHIRGHVYYESGDRVSGLKFLSDWWGVYSKKGQMHCHLSWHLALWELELGNTRSAWEIYRAHLHPGASWGPPLNALSDCASFLFRAEMAGELRDPELWKGVSEYASNWYPEPGVAFADIHGALAHALSGNAEALAKIVDGARGAAADRGSRCSRIPCIQPAGVERGHRGTSPLMAEHERVGGSRAQRDLIEYTLVVSLLRSDRSAEARRLLHARRLHSETGSWPIAGM